MVTRMGLVVKFGVGPESGEGKRRIQRFRGGKEPRYVEIYRDASHVAEYCIQIISSLCAKFLQLYPNISLAR